MRVKRNWEYFWIKRKKFQHIYLLVMATYYGSKRIKSIYYERRIFPGDWPWNSQFYECIMKAEERIVRIIVKIIPFLTMILRNSILVTHVNCNIFVQWLHWDAQNVDVYSRRNFSMESLTVNSIERFLSKYTYFRFSASYWIDLCRKTAQCW